MEYMAYSIYVNVCIERFNINLDIIDEMQYWNDNCDQKCLLMGECRTYGLREMSNQHIRRPNLASQEEPALRGLLSAQKTANMWPDAKFQADA